MTATRGREDLGIRRGFLDGDRRQRLRGFGELGGFRVFLVHRSTKYARYFSTEKEDYQSLTGTFERFWPLRAPKTGVLDSPRSSGIWSRDAK